MKDVVLAVIVFDQINPFHLSVPCQVFDQPYPGSPVFNLIICTAEEGPISTAAGFTISSVHGLKALDKSILKIKGNVVYTVRPEQTLAYTAAILSTKNVGVAVVCDSKDQVIGLVSERDIVRGIAHCGKDAHEMPVRSFMTSPVLTCSSKDTTKHVLTVMTASRVRHLPVVDDNELIGIISIGDAVNHRLTESQEELGVLRDFAVIR